jgi:hypothetical protein
MICNSVFGFEERFGGEVDENIEYSNVSAKLQSSIAKNAVIRVYCATVSVQILRIPKRLAPMLRLW